MCVFIAWFLFHSRQRVRTAYVSFNSSHQQNIVNNSKCDWNINEASPHHMSMKKKKNEVSECILNWMAYAKIKKCVCLCELERMSVFIKMIRSHYRVTHVNAKQMQSHMQCPNEWLNRIKRKKDALLSQKRESWQEESFTWKICGNCSGRRCEQVVVNIMDRNLLLLPPPSPLLFIPYRKYTE